MKQLCLVMFLAAAALMSSCSPLGQRAAPATGGAGSVAGGAEGVERVLAQAERQKAVDMASGRWTERWVADDLVITGADGMVLPNAKAPILENIRSGAWKVEAISVDNINVRVFGEAAVVTATQTERSQFRGADSGGRFQYTHLWVKRRGRWQVVAAHVTRLK